MRSLFRLEKENTTSPVRTETSSVATKDATVDAVDSATESATTMSLVVSKKETRSKERRVKRVLTPEEQRVYRRRMVVGALALSVLVGTRWYVANREPVYPKGVGVYPAQTAPKWGALTQPNAASFYAAAADQLQPVLKSYKYKPKSNIQYGSIIDEPVSVQKPIVEQAQPALELLRQGMQYPYYPDNQTNWFKKSPAGTGLDRPVINFLAVRETARLLVAEANVRASTGNTAGALSSSLDAARLGADVGQGHTLIEGMSGVLVEGMAAQEGLKHVDGLSGAEARVGAARLEAILDQKQSFAEILTQDRDWGFEVARDIFHQGAGVSSSSDSVSSALIKGTERLGYAAMVLGVTKQGLVNEYDKPYEEVIDRAKRPYQSVKQMKPVERSMLPIIKDMLPNTERARGSYTNNLARSRILLTRLAVQAYRAEHGGVAPASLSELLAGEKPYLKAIPMDPYSRDENLALGYDAKTGAVYSVGENAIDDQGRGDDADVIKPR